MDSKPIPDFKKVFARVSSPVVSSVIRIESNRNRIESDMLQIPDTDFLVDGFRFKNAQHRHYFLSHYHSDHYVGLNKNFKFGTIYMSQITCDLVQRFIGTSRDVLVPLTMNEPHLLTTSADAAGRTNAVEVTLLEANHCPGAVLFLFRVCGCVGCVRRVLVFAAPRRLTFVGSRSRRVSKCYLHTGDFRYDRAMLDYPALKQITLDAVYLGAPHRRRAFLAPNQTRRRRTTQTRRSAIRNTCFRRNAKQCATL